MPGDEEVQPVIRKVVNIREIVIAISENRKIGSSEGKSVQLFQAQKTGRRGEDGLLVHCPVPKREKRESIMMIVWTLSLSLSLLLSSTT